MTFIDYFLGPSLSFKKQTFYHNFIFKRPLYQTDLYNSFIIKYME